LVWDWTRGENIGLSNIPRLCWTVDAKRKKFEYYSINWILFVLLTIKCYIGKRWW
jgi:hypothetical protein